MKRMAQNQPASRASSAFVDRAARAGIVVPSVQRHDGLVVDVDRYLVLVDEHPVELSPIQVELLALFLATPGRLWTRAQLHEVCWGDEDSGRRVDVHLSRIRAAVGRRLFRNIRDRGWALAATPA